MWNTYLFVKRTISWAKYAVCSRIPEGFLFLNLVFSPENFSSGKSPFLKVLIDAEAASSAAAIQLVAFKDAVDNEFAVCFFCAILYPTDFVLNICNFFRMWLFQNCNAFFYYYFRPLGSLPKTKAKSPARKDFCWRSWKNSGVWINQCDRS